MKLFPAHRWILDAANGAEGLTPDKATKFEAADIEALESAGYLARDLGDPTIYRTTPAGLDATEGHAPPERHEPEAPTGPTGEV